MRMKVRWREERAARAVWLRDWVRVATVGREGEMQKVEGVLGEEGREG